MLVVYYNKMNLANNYLLLLTLKYYNIFNKFVKQVKKKLQTRCAKNEVYNYIVFSKDSTNYKI